MKTPTKPLTPPDRKRCQTVITPRHSFMMLGPPPKSERCTNPPAFLATERQPGPDGQRGSMSVCEHCRDVMRKQMPGLIVYEEFLPDTDFIGFDAYGAVPGIGLHALDAVCGEDGRVCVTADLFDGRKIALLNLTEESALELGTRLVELVRRK